MQYTQSDSFSTHPGTGNNHHDDSKPIPTAVSADDMNMVIWSLMEVVKNQGLAAAVFNKDDPATYQVLLNALRGMSGIGEPFWHLGDTPPPNSLVFDHAELLRADYPEVWSRVSNPANNIALVDDATGLSTHPGCWTTGDGATTFRAPQACAEFIKALDFGRGIDPARGAGTWAPSQNKSHTHKLLSAYRAAGNSADQTGNWYGFNSGGDIETILQNEGGVEAQPRHIAWLLCFKYK